MERRNIEHIELGIAVPAFLIFCYHIAVTTPSTSYSLENHKVRGFGNAILAMFLVKLVTTIRALAHNVRLLESQSQLVPPETEKE
jgi:hypothetical protein